MFRKKDLNIENYVCTYKLNDGSFIKTIIAAENKEKAKKIAISKMRFRRNIRLGNHIIPKSNIVFVRIEPL